MLKIIDLKVAIDKEPILKGINLEVAAGEVHVIMGPNGSGKSTLSKVLVGHPAYTVTGGDIRYEKQSILEKTPEERSHLGLFLSFQYPVEIPGVTNIHFLKSAVNAVRAKQGKPLLDAVDFLSWIREKCQKISMDESFLYRAVNEGFSGGEKKRNEILQMLALDPKLAILDETDSGLDIDALKVVAEGINSHRAADKAVILVTHYQRLLHYIKPDFVHVLANGRIVQSGDYKLALELEEKGYAWLDETAGGL